MRAKAVLAEPLAEVTALLLTKPTRHLYAALWRAGLLEVVAAARTSPPAEETSLRPAG
ncbi:Rv1535 domain-containing protein [Mycobacterium sp. UM_Kg1]|uniref:Rv1535 domain-containing protein n=1 Tax=Mycobacterium sp. UM_Kg1 TaxID=1545691 RepID=UPI000ABD9F47|nr:Rv1535 domain-containing protein [Mycobacterium sp. UM_Kg1]